MHSATTGLGLGAGRHSRSHLRKKKTRVVNLRKSKTTDDIDSEDGTSETASVVAESEPAIATRIAEEPEDNIIDPPQTPSNKVRFQTGSIDLGDSPRKLRVSTPARPSLSSKSVLDQVMLDPTPTMEKEQPSAPIFSREHRPTSGSSYPAEKASVPMSYTPAPVLQDTSAVGGILEQAWVLKMAGEIARRAHEQKAREGFWSTESRDEREDTPPPAYEPKAL
jgi:distribution and morphology protein 34